MILRVLSGVVLGGGLGFGFYKLIGCASGACPLTSNPWISTIYGGVIGAILATSIR